VLLAGLGAGDRRPLGWFWVKILSWMYADVFTAGVVVSWGGVLLGRRRVGLAALAASVLPAWQATRVSPLEAMTPDAAAPHARTPIVAAIAGLLLIAIDPLLFFGPGRPDRRLFNPADPESATKNVQFVLHFFIGLPGVMFGFFLVAPLLVRLVEVVAGPLVAAALRLNPHCSASSSAPGCGGRPARRPRSWSGWPCSSRSRCRGPARWAGGGCRRSSPTSSSSPRRGRRSKACSGRGRRPASRSTRSRRSRGSRASATTRSCRSRSRRRSTGTCSAASC
jgi:hypothetical protein